MAEKIFNNVRLSLKIDTLEAWQGSSLKLKEGEVAFATVAASAGTGLTEPVVMMKVGTAEEKTFSELPWSFHAKASDVLAACKSEEGLTAFVNGVITDSKLASSADLTALTGRVTTAEGKITALEGEMDAVEKKAGDNTAAITALQGLVGDTGVAAQITKAIADLDLANTYEVKGEAAKVQTALDTYKTSNDAAVQKNASDIAGEITRAKAAEEANANAISAIKDGTTIDSFADVETALAGKEASGAAAQALTDAKAYADGLADNYDAKGSAATAESNAKAYAKEYADGLAGNYDAKGDAAQALTDAKKYTDDEIAEWVGDKTVGVQISEAIANEKLGETYAAKSHKHSKADITDFAHTHEMGDVNGLDEEFAKYQLAGDYATKAEAQAMADGKDEAIAAAKAAGDNAQKAVDDLEAYVGTIPETSEAASIVAYVQEKTAGIATDAALGELTEKVTAAEGAIDAIEADYLKAADKEELAGAISDNAEAIAALDELVGDKAVATQISEAVAAEKTRAEAAEKVNSDAIAVLNGDGEGSVAKQVSDAVAGIVNGAPEAYNTLKEISDWIAAHPESVAALNASIKENTDAIDALETLVGTLPEGETDVVAYIQKLVTAEENRAKGVESGLNTRLAAVEAAVGTEGSVADAIAAGVAEAKGYTDTEVAKVQEAVDAIDKLVGDTAVATQITDAVNELKNGQLTTMQGEIDAVEGRADALEAKAHEHANKTVLDGIEASDITAWDAKVDDVTAAATSGLKATRTGNTIAIEIDDTLVWVLDCGTSAE